MPSFAPSPPAVPSATQLPSPSPVVARGWPTTTENAAGLYSWGSGKCAGANCIYGFMHNGYGSGDVAFTMKYVPGMPAPSDAPTVTIAEHPGWYRRIAEPAPSVSVASLPGIEEWIVDVEGHRIAITLFAKPGTSEADLAEAHAIVESIRYERAPGDGFGFQLVFTLATDDWDSG